MTNAGGLLVELPTFADVSSFRVLRFCKGGSIEGKGCFSVNDFEGFFRMVTLEKKWK